MENNHISLAGQVVRVTTCTAGFGAFSGKYLTDAPADWAVETTVQDILFEREKSAAEDRLEGRAVRNFSDAYLETLAVYRKIAVRMLQHDTLLMHGSAVAVDGKAYLFIAASGTGKSTHTRLWREHFGTRAVMVNDDKPLVRVKEDGVTVCGTPWDGKHRLSTPMEAELAGICILQRGERNEIQRITPREGYPFLIQQSYRPQDMQAMLKTMQLLERISKQVGLYRLHCNMQPEAAVVAFEGMNKGE